MIVDRLLAGLFERRVLELEECKTLPLARTGFGAPSYIQVCMNPPLTLLSLALDASFTLRVSLSLSCVDYPVCYPFPKLLKSLYPVLSHYVVRSSLPPSIPLIQIHSP